MTAEQAYAKLRKKMPGYSAVEGKYIFYKGMFIFNMAPEDNRNSVYENYWAVDKLTGRIKPFSPVKDAFESGGFFKCDPFDIGG